MGEENKTDQKDWQKICTFGIPQCLRDVYGDDEGKIDCIRLTFFNDKFDTMEAISTPRKGDLAPYKQYPVLNLKTLGSKKIKEFSIKLPTEFTVLASECLSPLIQKCCIIFAANEFAYVLTHAALKQTPDALLEIMDEYLELPEPKVNPTDG